MKNVVAKKYFERYDKLSAELESGLKAIKHKLSDKDRQEIIEELNKVDTIFNRILGSIKK